MSNACPFCHSVVPDPGAACPSCRRVPAQPSPPAASGWDDDDDDLGGGIDFSRGGSTSHASGPSAYSGGGLSLGDDDDPFADDAPQGSLELDVPTSHTASSSRSMPAAKEPALSAPPLPDVQVPGKAPAFGPAVSNPPRSSSSLVASLPPDASSSPRPRPQGEPSLPPRSVPEQPAPASLPRSPDPAALIARYPTAPTKVWESPAYAMRVLWRQLELRQDLASLRKKRSPDVGLYERALGTHDPKMFVLGLIITCAGLAVASFIFFLPVILRFLHDPD